jgi:hypothetical protein
MRKFVSGTSLLGILLGSLLVASCGSSSPTTVANSEIPATICLTTGASCTAGQSGSDASLEVGKTQQFTAQGFNSGGTAVPETFAFQSSNPSVLTIAKNGQACAGTWDSVTAPSVCTPGATGTTQVTALANGVTSPAVQVFVHQHVTNIVISKVPGQPPTLSPLCLTKSAPLLGPGPESVMYQAFAYSGPAGTNDITSTVGPFSWQSVPVPGQTSGSTSVSLTPGPTNSPQCLQGSNGQCFNMELATAAVPGATEIVASTGGVNSQPLPFTTCLVESIQVTPANNSPSTSFTVPAGTTTLLNATVKDTLNMTLTDVPLTWSASTPTSVSVVAANSNVFGSAGTVSGSAIGAGSVTASCTPPGCNGGIVPSNPIYSPQAFGFRVTPGTSTPPSPTAYVTTSACTTTTNQSCTTRILPLTRTSTTTDFTVGSAVNLPFAPNSVEFDSQGSNAYLGVQSAAFGTQDLMVFSGTSVSLATGVAGKVLAISPLASSSSAATVILSDTVDSPSRVLVCNNCSNQAARSVTSFLLPNAVSAAFSPDGLKAYIVSTSSCPGTSSAGCLLVYSTVDAPQFLQLNTAPTDVAFIGQGGFGYLGGSSTASFLATCDRPATFPTGQSFSFPSSLLRPLPDGQSLAALAPPEIQTMTATVGGSGCVAPRGSLALTNTVGPPFNLGVGNFTPKQFLVSPDGSMAYIVAQVQQAVNFHVTAASCVLNSSGTGCASPFITYTYTLTSGPAVALGANLTLSGMPAGNNGTFAVVGASGPAPNGSSGFTGTFTVANPSGVPANGLSGSASGTETLNFDFVLTFNLQSQTSSNIALVGSATPLSASLSPGGDVLFVGADDDQLHVINTATQLDIQQLPLTFPQNNSLCVGPGSPPTALQSLFTIIGANQDTATGTTTFGYALNSGPPVAVGNLVKVTGMADPGNNGTFVVTSVATASFTAVNPIGVTATSQNGSGSAGLACNPDLVFVKP